VQSQKTLRPQVRPLYKTRALRRHVCRFWYPSHQEIAQGIQSVVLSKVSWQYRQVIGRDGCRQGTSISVTDIASPRWQAGRHLSITTDGGPVFLSVHNLQHKQPQDQHDNEQEKPQKQATDSLFVSDFPDGSVSCATHDFDDSLRTTATGQNNRVIPA
jgi:hypothetical protein